MPKLNQWAVITTNDPYTAPELIRGRLAGLVTGHPRHRDGTEIVTGQIVGREGELVITRSGSRYELGEPAREYERLFPQARKRLILSLKEKKKFFVYVPKSPGHKFTLNWKGWEIVLYFGTHTHPWGKFYFDWPGRYK